jgi:flagellar motility protein MotE (MotC chaperone)
VHLRLIPLLVFAASAILALKAVDLMTRRGGPVAISTAMAASETPPAAPAAAGQAPATSTGTTTTQRPVEQLPQTSAPASSERALNERLADRRRQIEERARELDQREALVRAAERRMEERLEELKRVEQRIEQAVQQRQEQQTQQLRSLVVMYEQMKPKDAARIFERLDLEVLVSMATRINPRAMSEVLANMQPDAAQRLTVELARRSGVNVPNRQAPAAVGGSPVQTAPGARELPRVDQRRPG